jgi:hypothetical protein
MNARRENRSFDSTVAVSVAMLLLFIMLLEGMRPPASLAAPLLSVSSDRPPAGAFNVQILALEVTQGVRGDIPTRTTPHGDLVLPSDGAVHVANRRTVVRAYPWVEASLKATVPPLTARLWAYQDGKLLPGSPIASENPLLEGISEDLSLKEMRSDAAESWNFLLPQAWVTLTAKEEPLDLRFVVEANPLGPGHWPECPGCENDNAVTLEGQKFVYLPPLIIKPYFVDLIIPPGEDEAIIFSGPTPDEFQAALSAVYNLLPIGEGAWGLLVLPPTRVTWEGPLRRDDRYPFAETMVRRHLPGGSLKGSQPGIYYLFLLTRLPYYRHFPGDRGPGMAWVGKSYVQARTYGPTIVHELTHAIGLDHAGNGHGEVNGGGFNPDYPDEKGRVEPNAYGFDLASMKAVPPDPYGQRTYDFMSYGPGAKWVSIYTWENIARLLGQPNVDA